VLRARVRTAATVAIETVPLGTYVLVVSFGTRAHVVADRFVLTSYDREVLRQQAVDGLAMDDVKTDLGALETLLSEAQVALAAALGSRGFRLEMPVLSDGRPDPVDPRDTRTFDVLLGRPTTRSPLGGGVFSYAMSLHQRPATAPGSASWHDGEVSLMPVEMPRAVPALTALPPSPNEPPGIPGAGDATVPGLLGTAEPAAKGVSTDGSDRDRRIPWGWIVGGLVSVVVIGGCWVMKTQWQRQGRTIVEATTLVQSPVALVVTEYTRTPDGERRCVQDPKPLPYAPGMSLEIGSDPRRCAWVTQTPEAPARLAILQFARDGYATLTPGNGSVRLDDQMVEGPTRLVVDEPHILSAGAVELHLELARQLPEAEEVFFRRLQHPGQATAPSATPEAEPRAVA